MLQSPFHCNELQQLAFPLIYEPLIVSAVVNSSTGMMAVVLQGAVCRRPSS